MHRDAVPGGDIGPMGQCVERCDVSTAKRRRGVGADAVGQPHEVVVGLRDGDLLGKRARRIGFEAQRPPVVQTCRDRSAVPQARAEVERRDDAVADRHCRHRLPVAVTRPAGS